MLLSSLVGPALSSISYRLPTASVTGSQRAAGRLCSTMTRSCWPCPRSVMERRDILVGEHVTPAGSRCPVIYGTVVAVYSCLWQQMWWIHGFRCYKWNQWVSDLPGAPPWERKVEWRSRSRVQQPLLPFLQRKLWSWFLNYCRVCALSVCLPVCLSVYLSVCLSVQMCDDYRG